MIISLLKSLFPYKFKRQFKEHLGVPSLHWSLENLKRKNFFPKTILDIGAYEGLWTLEVLEVFPDAYVLMVEAQSSKEPYLKKISEKYSNVNYSISLLSSEDGLVKIFTKNETASHIVETTERGEDYEQLETQSLDKLLKIKNFPFPDFLKLDVQGHELSVLLGAEESLSHAEVCLLEITFLDLGDNSPLLSEMVLFMDSKGFQAYDISQLMRRPSDKALHQIDLFFVKKTSFLIADKNW